ncbi:MAG: hypothetical protein ACT4NV_00780 [Rhodoferax sp.]
MVKNVEHTRQDLYSEHAVRRTMRRLFLLGLFGILSALSTPSEAIGIGAYRCVSFNVGGAGGRCTYAPPIEIRADGTYSESSTTGRYTVRGDQVTFSESTIRGPGQLVDSNTIRFQYSYKGLEHTATYLCAACDNAPAASAASSQRGSAASPARVGVTLQIDFNEAISGATGFAIVPQELASQYGHRATLPPGSVTGLVIDISSTQVRLGTNRYNQIPVNRDYVVFLVYPAETVAVAAFHLPAVKSDWEAHLRGGIYRSSLPQAAPAAPAPTSANNPAPSADYPPAPAPGSPYSPPTPTGPSAYPAPPSTGAYPAPQAAYPEPAPANPGYPPSAGAPQGAPVPAAPSDPVQALDGFARALKTIGDLFNALGQPGRSPSTPGGGYPSYPSSPSGGYPAAPTGGYPAPAPGGYPAPLPDNPAAPAAYPAPAPESYPPPAAYPTPATATPNPSPATAYPAPPSQAPSAYPAPQPVPATPHPSMPSPVSGPKCNPSIPKYSQPGCVE